MILAVPCSKVMCQCPRVVGSCANERFYDTRSTRERNSVKTYLLLLRVGKNMGVKGIKLFFSEIIHLPINFN